MRVEDMELLAFCLAVACDLNQPRVLSNQETLPVVVAASDGRGTTIRGGRGKGSGNKFMEKGVNTDAGTNKPEASKNNQPD